MDVKTGTSERIRDAGGTKPGASALWPLDFEGAIFDFDGTLAQTHELWFEIDRTFLGMRGIEMTPDYHRALSTLGFAAGARYTIDTYQLDETVEDICDEWNRLGQAVYEAKVELRAGAEDYLAALRAAGVRTALATVNDRKVLAACRRVDPDALFDAQVYGTDVARHKEFPDIYLEAARRIGVEPARCIVFEDTPVALRSARAAGMCVCGVLSGDPTQDLRELRRLSDIVLADWRDIAL
jgi:HAD superfamily hydrolase (TIGR01509 family)